MATIEAQVDAKRPFTWGGVQRGLAVGWPFLFSSGAIGLIMGVTYRELGLDGLHAFLLSALLYSGTAQAVTAAMWAQSPLPLAAMMLAILSVNARYLVMGANLRQIFSGVPLRRMLPALFLLADANWQFIIDAMDLSSSSTFVAGYPNYFEQFNQRQEAIMRGDVAVADALAEAQATIEQTIADNAP